jgi:DNA repair protein RadD
MLRDYQQAAHDNVITWIRGCTEPCLVEAATGAGKSHIIAAIAETMHRISGFKHILCIAPSVELVQQNHEKYIATGSPASIFSAAAGVRDLRHPVVFGTPMTVKNKIHRFGAQFCAVVVDEAHGMTPTIIRIIQRIKEHNPNLRVIGLTATPYRLGSGYIYRADIDGNPMGEECCRDPYFARLVSQIAAPELIGKGYLSPPVIGAINTDGYQTLQMQINRQGKFDPSDIDRAFIGKGRKTAAVIADIVTQSRERKGVIIFAATVQHARECMESLPQQMSAILTGDTTGSDRRKLIADFKARKIKYLVNVTVLTTGFDAPHVDVVALLRATESVGLLQQIIGRGLRVAPGKKDCLILDYAENIDRHCPDGDVFSPQVKANMKSAAPEMIKAKCPDCAATNTFIARPNPSMFQINLNGYFIDLDGQMLETDKGQPFPAHYGRRCQAEYIAPGGRLIGCSYRWTFKECPHCTADNDIAARYCNQCKGELVDPNEKLMIEYRAHKKDPTQIQCDKLLAVHYAATIARSGRECIKADFVTEYRSFSVWYIKDSSGTAQRRLEQFEQATQGGQSPRTVTYRKKDSGFYETLAFNQIEDKEPELNENTKLVAGVREHGVQRAMPA